MLFLLLLYFKRLKNKGIKAKKAIQKSFADENERHSKAPEMQGQIYFNLFIKAPVQLT